MSSVLYITYDGLTDPLGQSQVLPYVCGLQKLGHDMVVLSFEKPKRSRATQVPLEAVKKQLNDAGVQWIRLRYHKKPTMSATAFDFLQGIVCGAYAIVRYRVGLIHARSYIAGAMGWRLSRLFRVPFLFDMRGFWADERVEAGLWPSSGFLYRWAKKLERRLFLSADAVVSLTRAGKRLIEQLDYLEGRVPPIHVIPTCVDLDRFQMGVEPRKLPLADGSNGGLRVLYAGSLGTWYALDELLAFFTRIKRQRLGSQLLLLTDTPAEALRESIEKAGLSAEDVIAQAVPFAEMPRWVSSADLGLCFIRPFKSKQASNPTKLGEWLACGVPVVMTDQIGDTREIIESEQVGVMVSLGEQEMYDQVAGNALRLLEDADLKHRCRRAAQRHFSLEEALKQYSAIYRQLLTERA